MVGTPSIFRGSYTDPQVETGLAMVLKSILGPYQNRVIVLCIGTDANIADSLGPLVGTMLVEAGSLLPIYGTLDQPLHARNLKCRLESIQKEHPGLNWPSTLPSGKRGDCNIEIKNGSSPRQALRKRLPQVGHIDHRQSGGNSVSAPLPNPMGRLGMVYRWPGSRRGILLGKGSGTLNH